MTKALRVVIDTNVLISGLFGIQNAPSAHILNAIRDQKIIMITSPLILEEIREVIHRERIIKLTKMTPKEQEHFMNMLIERSEIVEGTRNMPKNSRDKKDDKFLSCALDAQADYIVTGDQDLLILNIYEEIPIITPREMLKKQ